jgi:hypothetical protein
VQHRNFAHVLRFELLRLYTSAKDGNAKTKNTKTISSQPDSFDHCEFTAACTRSRATPKAHVKSNYGHDQGLLRYERQCCDAHVGFLGVHHGITTALATNVRKPSALVVETHFCSRTSDFAPSTKLVVGSRNLVFFNTAGRLHGVQVCGQVMWGW